ncbi:unnamed protein product [Cladocopium goreaui]|uniref:Uncharacterized protein n=1 Tax=Cladocopium goreaui TaxID=2562237 RepID=A0A9P1C6Q1_9DINO|nr:unnamed protein product [Cladocopium goreaui]
MGICTAAQRSGSFLGPTLGGLLSELIGVRSTYTYSGTNPCFENQTLSQWHEWHALKVPPGKNRCREHVDTGRAGERTLLSQSFPQFPKRRPCRGEINSSKYLAAEEAILNAEWALQSSSMLDDAWIQDIRATLSNEPDPHWSVWPAWKELVAAAHPLHDTLRKIEISEFSHKAPYRVWLGRSSLRAPRKPLLHGTKFYCWGLALAVRRSLASALQCLSCSRGNQDFEPAKIDGPKSSDLAHGAQQAAYTCSSQARFVCGESPRSSEGQTSIVAMGAETLCYSAVVFVVKNSGHGDEVSSIGAHLVFHENRSIAGRITQALLSNDERAEEWDGNDDEVAAAQKSHTDEDLGALGAVSDKTPNRRRFKSVVRKVQAKSTAERALLPIPAKGFAGSTHFANRMRHAASALVNPTGESPISPASLSGAEEIGSDFRLVDRRGAFGQSRGHWMLHNIMSRTRGRDGSCSDTLAEVSTLLLEDWYHTFLDAKISKQLCCFLVLYVFLFWVYAFLYLAISKACNLQLEGHLVKAYLLSLETMMTIGYGVPDPYMNGCWQGPFVLTTQVLVNLILSAILIGVIFQGIARPQSRACTILCSQKAIIRCIDGAYYFMFRVCDLRSQHALVEPHIRCYCVEQSDIRGFETTQMRLLQPDDELGATLLLSMPSIVVHRIDAWSPLAPHRPDLPLSSDRGDRGDRGDRSTGLPAVSPRTTPSIPHYFSALPRSHNVNFKDGTDSDQPQTYRERSGTIATFSSWKDTFERQTSDGAIPRFARASSSNALQSATKPRERGGGYEENLRLRRWPWPRQRQASNEVGQGDSCACPTCGQTFPTAETLKSHCKYSAASDVAAGMPKEVCHKELTAKELGRLTHRDPTKPELSAYLSRCYKEVVVIVEGIEPTTSATLQSRHSYLVGPPGSEETDTAWDMDFVDCVMVPDGEAKAGGLGVDLGRFHMLQRVEDAA